MDESSSVALVPSVVQEIMFYDDLLPVALIEEKAYIALRPIADYLEVDWSGQRQRLQRDEVLHRHSSPITMTGADGKKREMLCLELEYLPGWLFGISPSRVKPEIAPKLVRYREECFKALWREFGQALPPTPPTPASSTALTQVRDLALAVAQMAEQQIELQEQVITVNTRVDRAAVVVSDLQRRLSSVERRIVPPAVISEEQAAEISTTVKALAELMAGKDAGKNHYQGIFGELYRRYGISSYKLIRQEDYQQVLTFLSEWRTSIKA